MLCWKIFAAICLVQVSVARPQFLTFHDGKVGVNFGGYHAEAGLGGLLGGNNAGGGLSASAGTPHGQQAGAGIGGSLNGRAAGGAYAGASAGYGTGASAALGGGLDDSGAYGGKGAEAHTGGISTKTVTLSQSVPAQGVVYTQQANSPPVADNNQVVQKVHKKKAHDQAKVAYNEIQPTIYQNEAPPPPQQPQYQSVGNANDFDYRKFFDFGFFSNTAAGFGGPQSGSGGYTANGGGGGGGGVGGYAGGNVAYSQPAPVVYRKEVTVNTVPNYETRGHHYRGGTVAGGFAGAGVGAGGGASGNQRTLFDDIFNIPISALRSVNTLLNNKSAAGSAGANVNVGVQY